MLVWLAIVAAMAVAGWFAGKGLYQSALADQDAAEAQQAKRERIRAKQESFPADSPEGQWMEKVRNAGPADYPRLFVEWQDAFETDERYEGGNAPNAVNALKWLMARWLEDDPEGFLAEAIVFAPEAAADVLVEWMPQKATQLITGNGEQELNENFVDELARCLAKRDPDLFLHEARNFDGLVVHLDEWGWHDTIQNLAKTHAYQAAQIIAIGEYELSNDRVTERLHEVARNWGQGEPSMLEWIHSLGDSDLANSARHARLVVLAESESEQALQALYDENLGPAPWHSGDAARAVLENYAKAKPAMALRLLVEIEDHFQRYPDVPSENPFDESPLPPEIQAKVTVWEQQSPFSHLSNHDARNEIVRNMAAQLPKDPKEFMAALDRIMGEAGVGDEEWRQELQGSIISSKAREWSAEECVSIARVWGANPDEYGDDPTLRILSSRAARNDPYKALQLMEQFPQQERWNLMSKIIQKLPESDQDTRMDLLKRLPAEEWGRELGFMMGRQAELYTGLLETSLHAENDGVAEVFTQVWANEDPLAAAQWSLGLSDPRAKDAAIEGLMTTWLQYDADSAVAWAESLPKGSSLDSASQDLVLHYRQEDPETAWRWANAISDAATRARTYERIAEEWHDAPESFAEAHRRVRSDAGLPPLVKPLGDE